MAGTKYIVGTLLYLIMWTCHPADGEETCLPGSTSTFMWESKYVMDSMATYWFFNNSQIMNRDPLGVINIINPAYDGRIEVFNGTNIGFRLKSVKDADTGIYKADYFYNNGLEDSYTANLLVSPDVGLDEICSNEYCTLDGEIVNMTEVIGSGLFKYTINETTACIPRPDSITFTFDGDISSHSCPQKFFCEIDLPPKHRSFTITVTVAGEKYDGFGGATMHSSSQGPPTLSSAVVIMAVIVLTAIKQCSE